VVKLWNVERGQYASEFKAENTVGLNDIAWSRDGRLLATASDEPIIRIWDVHNQQCVKQLTGHTNYVMSVDFSPSSNLMIASGSFDESIRVWDAKTGQCLRTLSAHSDPVSQVTFNRDGTRLASGGYDGLIRVWDSSSGQCLQTIVREEDATLAATAATGSAVSSPSSAVSFVLWTPNSQFILAATLDSTLRLWDVRDKAKCIKIYRGHKNEKYCIFAGLITIKERPFVVSGSEDHLVYVWDLRTRQIVQRLSGHTDVVIAIACHPTRELIATGALEQDKTVKLWFDLFHSPFFRFYVSVILFHDIVSFSLAGRSPLPPPSLSHL
jgi:COMPASS component SWD3